jgi:hypothetical protein
MTLATNDSAIIQSAIEGERSGDQQRIATAGQKLTATLLRKNADYGSSAWMPPVLAPGLPAKTAILVRMSDKIQRIISLSSKPEEIGEVVDESLSDTFLDLAGYCLLHATCPTIEETPE